MTTAFTPARRVPGGQFLVSLRGKPRRELKSQAAMLALAIGGLAAPAVADAPPPPSVDVATPVAKRITLWDEYSGRFEAIASVEIRPRVSGFIDAILFKDGQIVKAGDPLFRIDPRPYEIALESAKADIERSNAQIDLQQSEVARATPLAKSGALTERELQTRQSNLNVARAALLSAQANVHSAELNLDWTTVRAPIAGRVSDKRVDVGTLVAGGAAGATLLTTIVTRDPIRFVFDASEADYLRYSRLTLSGDRPSSREVANPVRVKLADEKDFGHDGKMDFVDNAFNARSGTIRGRAILDNKDNLFQPGMFARIQLFGGESDALMIPDAAVVSDQARKVVFTVGADDMVVAKPVELGVMHTGLRVVLKGLAPSDRVIITGIANPAVHPGVKVAPKVSEIKAAAN